jgi:peptide/nickel transport system ATP-binding protein
VVAQVADDVLVMYGGRAVEYGTAEQVLRKAQMPYTWGLLSSIPSVRGDAEADLVPIKGNPPSLINLPPGCAFHPRCRYAMLNGGPCDQEVPQLLAVLGERNHLVACHLPDQFRKETYKQDVAQTGVAL